MIDDVMTGEGLCRPRQVSAPIPGCAEASPAGMIAPSGLLGGGRWGRTGTACRGWRETLRKTFWRAARSASTG
ncbi:hypothetical protein ACFRCW_24270 [Streptomyces sp. NPDC056653]|uniref:hypothetical protein n=1 Tax=Streptomyces sp. NPDC056653 TaxID=3345894 RepID=UPI003695538C